MLNKNKKLSIFPFRKVSLTFKITLWYTTFIVLLIGSLIVGTFLVSDSVVEKSSEKKLIEEVAEISSGSDKFTPYEDGVTLSVYDKDGNLVAGSVPRNFKVNDFSLGVISEYKDVNNNKYLYYDSETSSARLGNGKYVRGIVQITNNINGWILPLIIGVGSPFVILIIMYGGYLIIRSSLKPVRDMTETAEVIAKSNDLTKRIHIEDGADEVHKLGKVFNEMLETLENSSKRERQFSSDVSHELRTPISVIRAESEYGAKYTDSVEDAKESFDVIERQSKRMTSMINQILELSRLDSRLEIPKEELLLSDKIKSTLEDYKILFDNISSKFVLFISKSIFEYKYFITSFKSFAPNISVSSIIDIISKFSCGIIIVSILLFLASKQRGKIPFVLFNFPSSDNSPIKAILDKSLLSFKILLLFKIPIAMDKS